MASAQAQLQWCVSVCVLCRAQAHREKRLAQQDAKRQKLRQELERKEQQGAKARSEEDQARARLKVGIAQQLLHHSQVLQLRFMLLVATRTLLCTFRSR